VFERDPGTGALGFVEVERDGVAGVDGLLGARSVVVSPDDSHVYAAGAADDAVVVFERDGTTGALGFVEMKRDGVAGVDGLDGAISVAVSPDGAHLYAAGGAEEALAVFARDPGTGTLSAVEVERNDVGGVSGMQDPRTVAVHPDGEHVYVSSFIVPFGSSGLVAFARDASSGQLTFVEDVAGRSPIAVSGDGAHIYAPIAPAIYRPGFAGCDPAPSAGCHTAGRTSIRMLAPATVVDWKWKKGAAEVADFGSPTGSSAPRTHYALCVYDESGPPELIFRALAPDGGNCRIPSNGTCWKRLGTSSSPKGFKYKDGFRTPEGLLGITLKAGLPGKASIAVKASRKNVRLPTLPLALPLRVQLQASNGECWEATYTEAGFNNELGFGAATD
jgi:hypothetical protein